MTDIVDKLRNDQPGERQYHREARATLGGLLDEAAYEITRLRAENERLREELQQERAKHPARIGAVSLIARAALKGDSE